MFSFIIILQIEKKKNIGIMMEYSFKSRPFKDILTIQEFKVTPEEMKEIYPRAYALPEFFLTNLVSDERVVKCFTGKQALIHAFYYQLMKLGLQIEVEDKNYRDIIFDKFVKFDYIDEGELEDQLFSDFQYRKFMKDFIEIVEKQNFPNFEQKAQEFPIIDQILKRIFKVIVPLPLIMSLESSQKSLFASAHKVLSYLCEQFNITLKQVGPCMKFEQSDMFVYLENPDEVYIAFNDEFMAKQENQSHFTSTFKCGEGNSFVTKYHSQSGGHSSDYDKTTKRFDKSKYWNKNHPENSSILHHCSRFKESPVDNFKNLSEVQSIQSKSQSVNTSGIFHPIPIISKDDKKKMYSEFTNTFILEQLSPKNKENISKIKQQYRTRQSIRNQF